MAGPVRIVPRAGAVPASNASKKAFASAVNLGLRVNSERSV